MRHCTVMVMPEAFVLFVIDQSRCTCPLSYLLTAVSYLFTLIYFLSNHIWGQGDESETLCDCVQLLQLIFIFTIGAVNSPGRVAARSLLLRLSRQPWNGSNVNLSGSSVGHGSAVTRVHQKIGRWKGALELIMK